MLATEANKKNADSVSITERVIYLLFVMSRRPPPMQQSLLDMGYISSDDESGEPARAPTIAAAGGAPGVLQQSLSPKLRQVDDNAFELELEAENAADVRRLLEETAALRGLQVDAIEMLDAPGKLLDEADEAVEDAAENTKEAVKSLTEARKHQKKGMWLVRIIGCRIRDAMCARVRLRCVCSHALAWWLV